MKVSSVGIIGAMQIEIDAILGELENKTERRFGGLTFTSGTLAGVEVSVALCAPGKVNAAIAAQAMIDRLGPELILNIGVAGGIGKDVHIGDVVIAASCVEYDFDTSALDGCPAGEMSLPGFEKPLRFLPVNGELARVLAQSAQGLYGRAHLGVIATGDRFVADPAFGEYLQKEFRALACEIGDTLNTLNGNVCRHIHDLFCRFSLLAHSFPSPFLSKFLVAHFLPESAMSVQSRCRKA